MQGSQPSAVSTGKARLHGFSDRTLPPRVKQLLQGVQRQFGDELERGLLNTLSEYESQLFKLAEAARSSGIQAHYMAALREVRSHGGELPRSVLKALESALATLRDKVIAPTAQPVADLHHGSLSLVENVYMDEHTVINEIAGRTELRNSLALFLLGQRFGVLAGKPGYEAETLPVGPHALAQMVAQAMGSMDLSSEHRQLLLRQFDKQVLQFLGPMLEGLNIWLGQQGVLPHITHVPVRARPQDQSSASAKPAAAPAAPAAAPSASDEVAEAPAKPLFEQVPLEPPETRYAVSEPEPETADGAPAVSEAAPARWPGMPTGSPGDAAQDAMAFQTLRQLLAGRRSLMGKLGGRTSFVSEPAHTASSEDLNVVLDRMQHLAAAPVMRQGKAVTRTIAHLKQDMLMQLRAGQSDGAAWPCRPKRTTPSNWSACCWTI